MKNRPNLNELVVKMMQKQVKNISKICDFEVFGNQKIAKSNLIKMQQKEL